MFVRGLRKNHYTATIKLYLSISALSCNDSVTKLAATGGQQLFSLDHKCTGKLIYGVSASIHESALRQTQAGHIHRSESRWRNYPKGGLVRGYDKPIHGSCAIYFPGGIEIYTVHSPTAESLVPCTVQERVGVSRTKLSNICYTIQDKALS